jgi:hypothetical protein
MQALCCSVSKIVPCSSANSAEGVVAQQERLAANEERRSLPGLVGQECFAKISDGPLKALVYLLLNPFYVLGMMELAFTCCNRYK